MSITSTIINNHYGNIANFIIDKNEKVSLFNVSILNSGSSSSSSSNLDSLFIINGDPSILKLTRIKFENVSIENNIGTIVKSNVISSSLMQNNNNNILLCPNKTESFDENNNGFLYFENVLIRNNKLINQSSINESFTNLYLINLQFHRILISNLKFMENLCLNGNNNGCILTKDSSITLLSSVFNDNNNKNYRSRFLWNINRDIIDNNINNTQICIDNIDVYNDKSSSFFSFTNHRIYDSIYIKNSNINSLKLDYFVYIINDINLFIDNINVEKIGSSTNK